jgi:acyl carrier protein
MEQSVSAIDRLMEREDVVEARLDGDRMTIGVSDYVSPPDLWLWLVGRLSPAEIPRVLEISYAGGAVEVYEFIAPSDDLEMTLAKIWEEVLGRQQVGAEDDLLDLGGDSLVAIEIVTRVNSDLGAALDGSALFRAGTVRNLARMIRAS